MTIGVMGPVAAPLADGKVFIAGGEDAFHDALTGAEVFNPATDAFEVVGGAMTEGRIKAVAAPLADGRILIAGGHNGIERLRSAEIYDPTTETFEALASELTADRFAAVAEPLPDGNVLIAGGYGAQNAEVFNASNDTFEAISGAPTTERASAVAATLSDGRVLIAGGTDQFGGLLWSAEAFNPTTDTFEPLSASPAQGRTEATATPLSNGMILIPGGYTGEPSPSGSAEVFNQVTGTFQPLPAQMTTGRADAASGPLPDGEALIAGGNTEGGFASSGELLGMPLPVITGGEFGDQTVGRSSAGQTFVVTNLGQAPFRISGVQLSGPDAGDFVAGRDECLGREVVPGESCALSVRFVPSEAGAREAKLLLREGEYDPADIELTGTGVAPNSGPTGPTGETGASGPAGETGSSGATGATGPAGSAGSSGPVGAAGSNGSTGATGASGSNGSTGLAGATGPQGATGKTGPAGEAELVSCLTQTTVTQRNGHTVHVEERRCSAAPLSNTTILGVRSAAQVTLRRGPVTYATGTGLIGARGHVTLLLVDQRPLTAGGYVLVLRRRQAGHWKLTREHVVMRVSSRP